MKQDILHYVKFIGGIDRESAVRAEQHFQSIGLKTKLVSSPEAAELAKLTETTYFGVLIAWAQEVSRYCDQLHVDYGEVASFYDEIPFLPRVRYTPGVIGGHCVMPNIDILRKTFDSALLDAIVASNELKIKEGQSAVA
jgi:UDP-N-acetyl-D-mannosaminuronate dehydrogenase